MGASSSGAGLSLDCAELRWSSEMARPLPLSLLGRDALAMRLAAIDSSETVEEFSSGCSSSIGAGAGAGTGASGSSSESLSLDDEISRMGAGKLGLGLEAVWLSEAGGTLAARAGLNNAPLRAPLPVALTVGLQTEFSSRYVLKAF